jgi:hypothetical protein
VTYRSRGRQNCIKEGNNTDRNLERTYHNSNSLALVGNANAATAVGRAVPELLRHAGRAIDRRGEGVVGESTGALLPAVLLGAVEAVAGSHALVQRAADQVALVHGHLGGDGRESGQDEESRRSSGGSGKRPAHDCRFE